MAKLQGQTGITRVELVVIVCASLFFLACVIMPGLARLRQIAFRASCAHNLSAIGKAMLTYASDHHGALPRAGGPTSTWGGPIAWHVPDRVRAFQLAEDGSGGHATISSSLYLLVKYGHIPPKTFVCRSDTGTIEFQPIVREPNAQKVLELSALWDFGESFRHCSYAYHNPYSSYRLTADSEPGMAVAADRNPWIPGPAVVESRDFGGFKPDMAPYNGSAPQGRRGNSTAHQEDGQNVLFLDGHASFQKRSYCGIDKDNIYLASDRPDGGSPLGAIPAPAMAPLNNRDSVLVNDPDGYTPIPYRATMTHEARDTDSKDLHQTVVVATSDCPVPEHKNAIWCSTFQMAWDRFKRDVAGEAIQVVGAEELANRLNHAQFPAGAIEDESYYAAAGFVKSGIIEQIRREMSRRFPAEPVPVFDERYRTLEDVVVAYAYLSVDAAFTHAYYTYQRAFSFECSNGTRADVIAFCAQNEIAAGNHQQIRDQVEVLYYDCGETPETAEFAVDLCKYTEPYQVVLARMPQPTTLTEAARIAREKAAAFKTDPNYETLRRLRPIDTLIVPDVLYKLTHRFDDLLGKSLGNAGWQRHFFFEAMQRIDFTLSRTGVILKSEARLGAAAGMPRRSVEEPRRLHFDKPFLICVKKRDADAPPFFIMWVDNAELMKRY